MLEHNPSIRADHLVIFYEEQDELVRAVKDFIDDGGPGAAAVVVATPEHQARFDAEITRSGVRYIDAKTLLDSFCVDGDIDPGLFARAVGGLLEEVGVGKRPVRVFGEMVALLWRDGLVSQAIELEQRWCELGDEMEFSLLCAYPSTLVLDHDEPEPVNKVCELHRKVLPLSRPEGDVAVRAFTAEKTSVREARRFLRRFLGEVDDGQADKVQLIVSELAANAVQHAGTPFVVEIMRHGSAIRVSVRDRSKRSIAAATPAIDAESGRGLSLVDALSDKWGVRRTKHGKVVWAEVNADK